MDKIDRKILACLDEDARMPITKIAKKTRISPQLAKFRLERIEKNKIISEYYTILDIARLGYTSYRVLASLTNTDKQKFQEIIGFLSKEPNTFWLINTTGRYDIIFNILARNPPHFGKLMKRILTKFPDQFKNYTVGLTTCAYFTKRKYLYGSSTSIEKLQYFGEEKELTELPETDRKILQIIARNARMPATEIARKTGTATSSVIERIKKMEKTGLIQGYYPLLHLENIGFQAHKIMIKLYNRDIKRENQLFAYAKMHKYVSFFIHMIAPWDLEIEVEIDNPVKLQEIIMELRDKFGDIIKDIEIINLYHDYFYDYFPKD